MQIQNKEKGIKISEIFEDELDAAKKYDYWIKKYNLKRTGNFINKQTT
jgi:hypothetical protein